MRDVFLAVPFGLAIGLSLGLVGGGGSILAVPVLVYVLGEPVKEATTASLAIVGVTAAVGAADHARRGAVLGRVALLFAAGGAVGALAGTFLNRRVDERFLLLAFAFVMLASAYAMARGRVGAVGPGTAERAPLTVATGAGVGVLTGLFGVGGGFVVVPALVLLLGLNMPLAVGTSLLVIALTSAVALAAHLATGTIDWAVAGAFAGASILGALAGGRIARDLSGERLSRIFAAVVVVVACVLIVVNVR